MLLKLMSNDIVGDAGKNFKHCEIVLAKSLSLSRISLEDLVAGIEVVIRDPESGGPNTLYLEVACSNCGSDETECTCACRCTQSKSEAYKHTWMPSEGCPLRIVY